MLALADNADSEGLCYPFVKRIANHVGLKERQVQNILTKLEKEGYLKREERFKRNRQQSSNCYQIEIKKHHPKIAHCSTETHCGTEKLSTGVHSNTPMGALQCTPPDALECTPTPQKNDEKPNKNNTLTTSRNSVTKSSLTNCLTEREEPLSDFVPNDENCALAKTLNLDIEEEIQTFLDRHKWKKTQDEFSKWMRSSREWLNKRQGKIVQKPQEQQVSSAYQEYGPGHPRWEMLHGAGSHFNRTNNAGQGSVQKIGSYF